ncbi:YHS domain-containing (seleno)protein [Paracoccus aminophilus]|uniref:YHS domain-containing protein n=1 Tax=Paracoccus aminophilus JCM 7686 TaxID=1367847 RepID=S5YCQ0_PARAH|nr:YHS domain-containing (seleno)protein [Paracoccus aminophilus]AGT09223.1 hypothetical protein JCM7686_2142 [Paracoccus aminophilus JCM 7686]
MIRRLTARAAALCACALPVTAQSQDWALDGMDPVAYLADDAALPGRNDLVTIWHGQAWHFANEENRSLFESNPREYAPGLDGLCVVALAEGRSEPGNPRYFVVINNRAYFVRSAAARDKLAGDPERLLSEAKESWKELYP